VHTNPGQHPKLLEIVARPWWLTAATPTPALLAAALQTSAIPSAAQLRALVANPPAWQIQGRFSVMAISEAEADRTLLGPTATPTAGHRSISVRQVHTQQLTASRVRVPHATPGVPTALQRRDTAAPPESIEQLWDRRQGNALYLLVKGVVDTTATTYCTGWKHWLAMCREYEHMDPFLQVAPSFASRTPMPIQIPFQVTARLHFIAYLAERGAEDHTHKLKATTILDYVTAVRHFLQINLVDVSFMKSPLISKVKSALATEEVFDDLVLDTKNLAFTPDMILHFKRNIANQQSFQDRAIILAMELQFTALNRVSELLPTAADYYARAIDIKFGFELDASGEITTAVSPDSWGYDVSQVRNMTYRIRGSKTDQRRRGVSMFFEIMDESNPDVAFCVVRDAFRWAQEARPIGEDAFLSYHNSWGLGYDQYNRAFKVTAIHMDLPPERFSTHSARIGGASALAAAGLPDWQIKKLGRWKSLAFLEYIQTALTSMRAAQVAMVNPATFSVADTRRIHHLA